MIKWEQRIQELLNWQENSIHSSFLFTFQKYSSSSTISLQKWVIVLISLIKEDKLYSFYRLAEIISKIEPSEKKSKRKKR